MNQTESNLIRWLRFPLTLAVVAQHCMGAALIDWPTLGLKDVPGLAKTLVSGCLAQVAVPAFFFISGFLFFQGVTRMNLSTYRHKLSRRLHSLFIPYVLWCLLSVPLVLLAMYGETKTGTSTLADIHDFWHSLSLKGVFWNFGGSTCEFPNLLGWPLLYASPVLGPFWFVRDLIIVSVLSPFVWWIVTKTRLWGLAVLVAVYLLRLWPYVAVNAQILFFVFGAYWSVNGWRLTFRTPWWVAVYAVGLALLVLLVRLEGNATFWGFQLMPLFTVVGTAIVLNLAAQALDGLPQGVNRWCQKLSASSFFVFALHMNFGLPLGFFVTKTLFRGATGWLPATAQYLITPWVIYAICLAVYAALSRLAPRLLGVLTGNR